MSRIVIQALDVDRAEPAPDGQDCEEDQALPVGFDGRGVGADRAADAQAGAAGAAARGGVPRGDQRGALSCALWVRLVDAAGAFRPLATELVHAMLDKQYRALLDEPVPMLGDRSPRKAASTPAGRVKLVAWLKFLENRSGGRDDPTDPMATYDFSWLWRELGVEALRV